MTFARLFAQDFESFGFLLSVGFDGSLLVQVVLLSVVGLLRFFGQLFSAFEFKFGVFVTRSRCGCAATKKIKGVFDCLTIFQDPKMKNALKIINREYSINRPVI